MIRASTTKDSARKTATIAEVWSSARPVSLCRSRNQERSHKPGLKPSLVFTAASPNCSMPRLDADLSSVEAARSSVIRSDQKLAAASRKRGGAASSTIYPSSSSHLAACWMAPVTAGSISIPCKRREYRHFDRFLDRFGVQRDRAPPRVAGIERRQRPKRNSQVGTFRASGPCTFVS